MSLPKELTTVTSVSKILAAVVFIILPFFGLYIGYKYEQQFTQYLGDRTTLDQYITRPSPAASPSASTANPDSIGANWKTYINSKYGFSIKYPMGWSYLEVPNATYKTTTDQVWLSDDGQWPMPQTDSRATITIELTKNNPSVDWGEEFFTDYKKETITLDNISAEKISGVHKQISAKRIVVIADIGDYYLVSQPASFDDKSLAEFDQILSTFQFSP